MYIETHLRALLSFILGIMHLGMLVYRSTDRDHVRNIGPKDTKHNWYSGFKDLQVLLLQCCPQESRPKVEKGKNAVNLKYI